MQTGVQRRAGTFKSIKFSKSGDQNSQLVVDRKPGCEANSGLVDDCDLSQCDRSELSISSSICIACNNENCDNQLKLDLQCPQSDHVLPGELC